MVDRHAGRTSTLERRRIYRPCRRAAAVDQIDITTNAKGETRTRINLADKKGALLDLARNLGIFAEKPTPSLPERVTNPDPLLLEQIRKVLPRRLLN